MTPAEKHKAALAAAVKAAVAAAPPLTAEQIDMLRAAGLTSRETRRARAAA